MNYNSPTGNLLIKDASAVGKEALEGRVSRFTALMAYGGLLAATEPEEETLANFSGATEAAQGNSSEGRADA